MHSLLACDVFHNPDSNWKKKNYGWTVRRLCVTGTNLGKRKHNELERVLSLCLTLDWRWSDVLLTSTLTREKTLTFLYMQKMCDEVDAHKKWMTLIRHFRQIINEFWRTPSESQRTDQNSSFFCALEVRDGMCDWAFTTFHILHKQLREKKFCDDMINLTSKLWVIALIVWCARLVYNRQYSLPF